MSGPYLPKLVDAVAAELAAINNCGWAFDTADPDYPVWAYIRGTYHDRARRILDLLDERGVLLRADPDAAEARGGSAPAAGAADHNPRSGAAPAPGPDGEGRAGGSTHPQAVT